MNVITGLHIMSFCANNSNMYSRSFVFIHFWQPLCVYSINAACISFCREHRFSQRTTSWVRQVFTSYNNEMWHIEYYTAVKYQRKQTRLRSRRAVHTSAQKRSYPYWILLRQAWLHFRKQTAFQTWKLHVCGGETVVTCRLMEARPCRQKAKASFLYRTEADGF